MQEEIGQVQIFGDFNEEVPGSEEYLVIGFSPGSMPLKQRWRNNGLSADFLAEYLATFFPGNEEDTIKADKTIEVKSAVSYVANELLENAMKFNDETSQQPISIKLEMHNDRLIFFVKNSLKPKTIAKFQSYIQELLTGDRDELYIRQLEHNVQDENSGSGLGLLSIMNDYLATVGWKFEASSKNPEIMTVTTMVQLDL
ncbi:MAG: ATP-binding protein [Leptolyngbyaceae cyanobacterium CSU_1_4]|nr:ATP-binding protein [Leptolyngbyaceae cyanobacterium CSU_1_4]